MFAGVILLSFSSYHLAINPLTQKDIPEFLNKKLKRQVRDSNPCMLAHNRYLVFDLEAVAVPLG